MDTLYTYSRRYRGPLRGVILDWAGTTLDYGCFAPAVVFVEVFERQGVPITIEEARVPMGAHKKVHIRRITQLEAVAERWQQQHGRAPDESDVERMFRDFVPLQMEVLGEYAGLIPGTLEAVLALRRRGLKIGSSTGYTGEMMRVLLAAAKRQGYAPDASVCATDVPAGRPEPWMCLQNARELGIYPMEAMVKVGDTLPDIEEGLNAGMWTVGLAKTGNEMGMKEQEIAEAPPELVRARLSRATERMLHAGAHEVVDGIWDVPTAIDRIAERHARGERP
jgi:phosphonoacetaldehyde hydrolase